jgi:hypothetical protein
MYTTKPIPFPANEFSTAIRPWLMLRDTRYIMFGPGVSTIPSAVTVMPAAAAVEISTFPASQTGATSSRQAVWAESHRHSQIGPCLDAVNRLATKSACSRWRHWPNRHVFGLEAYDFSLGGGASEGAAARGACAEVRSAGRQRRFVWLGCSGLIRGQLCLCRSSLSSRRVNGHHPWIRITRVNCGQDPGRRCSSV